MVSLEQVIHAVVVRTGQGSWDSFEERVLQVFSSRPAGPSEMLHVGLETSLLGMEGKFLQLVMMLNALSCETATLSVLHEMRKAEF